MLCHCDDTKHSNQRSLLSPEEMGIVGGRVKINDAATLAERSAENGSLERVGGVMWYALGRQCCQVKGIKA